MDEKADERKKRGRKGRIVWTMGGRGRMKGRGPGGVYGRGSGKRTGEA